jgi:hypothetical protein
MPFYPQIRDETVMSLNVVVQNIEKDGSYLDHPDCPYSDTVKNFFRKKIEVSSGNGSEIVDLFEEGGTASEIDTQVISVINELEGWGNKLTTADNSDKMGYFRTKTALLDKLLNMRERAVTIKEVNDFRQTIVTFMDEVLTKDQITDFMRRIDGILGTRNDNLSE